MLRLKTAEEYLVIALVLICLISMGHSFYSNPSALIFEALNRKGFPDVLNVLFYMEAGNTLLQGLSLLLMLRLESPKNTDPKALWLILLIQVLGIVHFGVLQIVSGVPVQDVVQLSVYSPFEYKHSYGSYIIFLFFIFLSQAGTRGFVKLLNLFIMLTLGLAVFLSYSRMTMVSLLIVLILYCWKYVSKKILIVSIMFLCIIAASVNIFYPYILKLNNKMAIRYAQVVDWQYYSEDCNLISRKLFWNRAFNIIKTHPLSGAGIGSYFSGSLAYQDPDMRTEAIAKGCGEYADKLENAHNYLLQVAAELGLTGLLIFLAVLFSSPLIRGLWRDCPAPLERCACGVAYGLLAYVLTWMTGHPLLLSVQQFLFWGLLALAGRLPLWTSQVDDVSRPANLL